MQVSASVPTHVHIEIIDEISSTITKPILYEPTLWETLTTFIQNVINLI